MASGSLVHPAAELSPFEVFPGTPGDDSYTGTADADQASGGDGNDALNGAGGDDTLSGGNGNDNLTGGSGNDFLDGGPGYDRAIYSDAASAVTIDLNLTGAQDTGGSGMDTLVGIEALNGSAFADTLIGDGKNNELKGAQGDDILEGGGGNDILYGGQGFNTASFAHAAVGVHVDLGLAGPQNTGVGKDTLTLIQALLGSSHNDVLTASNSGSTLDGGDGIDKLVGGYGDDTLNGGAGNDKIYSGDGTDILSGGDGDDHFYFHDTALSPGSGTIDGGDGADTLEITGDEAYTIDLVNDLIGYTFDNERKDYRTKFTSIERFVGENSLYEVFAGDVHNVAVYNVTPYAILDTTDYDTLNAANVINLETGVANHGRRFYGFTRLVAGDTANTITGSAGDDEITTGKGNDTIAGGDGDDTITASGGTNVIDGGAGADTVFYNYGVTVDLRLTGAQDTGHSTDTLTNVENISILAVRPADSVLTGDDADNVLRGGGTLSGNGGDDTLAGYYGADNVLDGGLGDDRLIATADTSHTDTFAFTTTLGPDNIDLISNFDTYNDKIGLDHDIFTGLAPGTLVAGAFYIGAAAHDADDRIIYNKTTGALYFDSDGNGGAAQIQFATLDPNLALTLGDFIVT